VVVRRGTPGRVALLAIALLVIAGCASAPENPPGVRVQVGAQDVVVQPTQFCVDGEGRRYDTAPTILEVSPDTTVTLAVPPRVAERGWSVQIFDERLEQTLGEVDVPGGQAVFDEISTSDVVPPAFYLVVIEDGGGECGAFSGAWPVGLIRAGGDVGTTTPPSRSPSPTSPSPAAPTG
jgi:hypothetical protein